MTPRSYRSWTRKCSSSATHPAGPSPHGRRIRYCWQSSGIPSPPLTRTSSWKVTGCRRRKRRCCKIFQNERDRVHTKEISMTDIHDPRRIELSLTKKYNKKIWSRFIKGIKSYELISEGDRIAVCISGGKDSMLLAYCMQHLHKYSDFPFHVEYIVMDPGYSPANRAKIEENAHILGIPIHIFESTIFDTVADIEQNPCYLCARMRRGHLYSYAESLGCTKIALGHHFDDVIETIVMGMLYGAQMQTMMPRVHSSNFTGM
ncbi:MAG: tRNA 2-thiocytidine biosynthesis protein TtcA, partial [Oscillospiraceae bacterium]|nr:tRNA 2-thiocytidine biosynthesis protein TtcA [Oscillospiraceae bacterium]